TALLLSPRPTTYSPLLRVSFAAPAPPAISTLSLHDALPISRPGPAAGDPDRCPGSGYRTPAARGWRGWRSRRAPGLPGHWTAVRSEEHTSELQSRENLVCRLLPEQKKRRARRAGDRPVTSCR